jgi:hypothetical protein
MTPKEQYQKFLRSPFWIELRRKAIERDGGKCSDCGDVERLRVHHKVYRSDWYQTKLEDLITLCNTCHRFEHGLWVRLPIDDLYLEIKTHIGQERRPPKDLWLEFRDENNCDFVTEMLAELIMFYCQSILRKDRGFYFAVRNSILSRCDKYKHLAKNSEWQQNFKRLETHGDGPAS